MIGCVDFSVIAMSGWQNGKIDTSQLSGFGVSVSQDQRGFHLAPQPTFNNHTGRNPSRERDIEARFLQRQ